MDEDLKTARAMIVKDFELASQDEEIMTEEELFDLLANQIAYLIEHRLEFLLSLMYRLDISEAKVNFALSPFCEEPANRALARLVLERQKKRAFTKRHYKPPKLDDMDF